VGTVALYVAVLCGVWTVTWGRSWLIPVPLLGTVAAALFIYREARNLDTPGTAARVVIVMMGAGFLAGLVAALGWTPERVRDAVFGGGAVLFTGQGLRLLLRSWSGRRVLLTLLLALVPVVPPWILGMGTVGHAFYAARFGVPSEDVEIPDALRVLAAFHALWIMLLVVLAALACWGYVRHCYPWLLDRGFALILAGAVMTAAGVVWLSAITDPAVDAAEEAQDAWADHRVPPEYWGIKAGPVCVTPVVPVDELPADGGVLRPSRVYASFGAVDGWMTLWDPHTKDDFSVAADKVRVVSAGPGEPGDEIPGSCERPHR
jgi:hypothetical protein